MADPKADETLKQKADDAKAATEEKTEAAETKAAEEEAGVRLESFDGQAAKGDSETEETELDAEGGDPKDVEIAQLKDELDDVRQQMMRAAAEVQNIRRRAERDRKEAETYGGVKLARDVLVVYDNLAKALAMVDDTLRKDQGPFIEGLELVQRELLNAFSKHKITPVDPETGDKFDPNEHQAMFESPVGEPGTVVQVMQPGFMIGERLLRPAMVGVAAANAKPAPKTDDGADKDDGKDKTEAN